MTLSQDDIDEFNKRMEGLNGLPEQPDQAYSLSPVDHEFNSTQAGLAQKLAEQCGKDLRYHKALGWLAFCEGFWQQDIDPVNWAIQKMLKTELEEAVKKVSLAASAEADAVAKQLNPSQSKALKKKAQAHQAWIKGQLTAQGMSGIEKLAQFNENFKTHPSQFDQHKTLLNCLNGTLNLNSGEMHEHRREDYLTKRLNYAYNPAAECPTWERFIDDIMVGNAELVRYIQQIIGLCLSGDTENHHFFILHGGGRNGKSTLIMIIQQLLGAYALEVPASLLMNHKTNPNGHTEGLARLAGVRLATANESDEDKRLAEAQVKQMTGGDMMTARKPYAKESFDFNPEFKLFLRTNHMPKILGTDNGIWSRIKKIPFDAKFTGAQCDKTLPTKLKDEMEGILAWAVRGYHDYLAYTLVEPEKVKIEVQLYRDQQDSFRLFLMSELLPSMNAGEGILAKDLQQKYEEWAIENDGQSITSKRMSVRLEQLGWDSKRTSQGMMKYPPTQSYMD